MRGQIMVIMNFVFTATKSLHKNLLIWGLLVLVWPGILSAQDAVMPDFKIKSVIADSFPEVVMVLKGERSVNPDPELISLFEDDKEVEVLSFKNDRENHTLKVAILFDCSETMLAGPEEMSSLRVEGKELTSIHEDGADNTPRLSYAKDGVIEFMHSLKFPGDSMILVNYASDVSNTDLNDNLEVMEMILGSLEPENGRVFYDALQLGIEALLPHNGRKIVVALVAGKDNGSDTPLETILQSSDILDIPIYIIGVGEVDEDHMQKIAKKTGGSFNYARSAEELEQIFLELSKDLQEVYELKYRSPVIDPKINNRRSIRVYFEEGSQDEFSLKNSYRIPIIDKEGISSNIPSTPKERNYLGMIAGVLVCLLLLGGFIWWKRKTGDAGLIVPAITQMIIHPKRPELKANVNIPLRDRPARFTIYSGSGSPIRDFVFSGGKRKVKVDISGLDDGIYYCVLSNGGLDSEKKELIIDTY